MTAKTVEVLERERLPAARESLTHKFTIDGVRCYAIVGLYPDGRPGELFLKIDKMGTTVHGFADAWSTLFSMALQYGIPLKVLTAKFSYVHFEPNGVTGSQDKDLRFADSIVDYVARWLDKKFGGKQ